MHVTSAFFQLRSFAGLRDSQQEKHNVLSLVTNKARKQHHAALNLQVGNRSGRVLATKKLRVHVVEMPPSGDPYLILCQRIHHGALIAARKLRKYCHKALTRNADSGSIRRDWSPLFTKSCMPMQRSVIALRLHGPSQATHRGHKNASKARNPLQCLPCRACAEAVEKD